MASQSEEGESAEEPGWSISFDANEELRKEILKRYTNVDIAVSDR